jgi:biopolymer transport protein ExbB
MFEGDAVHKAVAALLLLMSLASWSIIFWKSFFLRSALAGLERSVAAFWQAPDVEQALHTLPAFDRAALLTPLIEAGRRQMRQDAQPRLAAQGSSAQQLTRVLRDALQAGVRRLQSGQVILASVGSMAPFVGLLGTVWGIYGALATIAQAGQISIAQVAGPVGESLIMTAAGLAVAIPAVLGYNLLGRLIGRIEADLEGFARDLRELLVYQSQAAAYPPDGALD